MNFTGFWWNRNILNHYNIMNKLVSILTPCYNGEKYIERLLNSILNQTYPKIEMFVIDDGSTDNSAKLIQSYIPRFEAKGYSLSYIYQDNSGQSAAINNGLKLVKGDYLVWPDSDDFYSSNTAIEQLVEVIDGSDTTVSMVRCLPVYLAEDTLKQVGKICLNKYTKNKTNLFEDCLFCRNGYWFIPGDYMAKIKKIDELIPDREIYTTKHAGQNWQLMLPLLYKHKLLTIEQYLYNIVSKKDSWSRGGQYILEKYSAMENTLLSTIENMITMSGSEKENYKQKIREKYNYTRFSFFLRNRRFKEAKRIIKNTENNSIKMFLKYYFYHIPFADFLIKIIRKSRFVINNMRNKIKI
jgi:glycosyltransferase involved in cell wall biosynthesis